MLIRDVPLGTTVTMVTGQYAGMRVTVTEHVVPPIPADGWTGTAHGYTLGTLHTGSGDYGSSIPWGESCAELD